MLRRDAFQRVIQHGAVWCTGRSGSRCTMVHTVLREYMYDLIVTVVGLIDIIHHPSLIHTFLLCLLHFIHNSNNIKGALIPLRLVGSFLEFIPARLGRNAALDDAVSCLRAIYRGPPSIPYNIHRTIRQSYVKALSLRGCLNDSSLRMESETLCSSILLQLCEVSVVITLFLIKSLAKV
jgi:hypothetical protein